MQSPPVMLSDGIALVALARSAMVEYLDRRTPCEDQMVPARLSALDTSRYGAAVTLRDAGKFVGQAVSSNQSLPRNVIAASLKAMRSSLLPDLINREYLDSLTVEVEVLGRATEVAAADIPSAIHPGYTGLMLTRGEVASYCLPSTAYLKGMDSDRMKADCLVQASPQSISQPAVWSAFAAKHYVGYPTGKTVWLYRGKALLPPENIDANSIDAAAGRVGAFLVRHQHPSGAYRCSESDAPMLEHLYATYAMQKLARHSLRPEFASSVTNALRYVAETLKTEGNTMYVATDRPEDNLAATSLLLLTLMAGEDAIASASLKAPLLAYIKKEMTDVPKMNSRLSATQTAGRSLKGAYLACMAMEASDSNSQAARLALAEWRDGLSPIAPADAETDLWRQRAGVGDAFASRSRPRPNLLVAPAGEKGPLDEAGGYSVPGQSISTILTALTAVNLEAKLAAIRTSEQAALAPKLAGDLVAARRFCYQMAYWPWEAYFAGIPSDWVGAVRCSPESAMVTVESCAAGIEALLTTPPASK